MQSDSLFPDLYYELLDHMQSHAPYHLVMLLAGSNHLSNIHQNGKISPVFDDVGNLVENMTY